MRIFKTAFRLLILIVICSVLFVSDVNAAGNFSELSEFSISADSEILSLSSDNLKDIEAKNVCVMESGTKTVLFEKNSHEKVSASHSAKLMTLLVAGEKIQRTQSNIRGKLSMKDNVVISENANSQPAPQIWLEKGEKITVEELVKSITVGNSNDGCVALAEKISGNEKEFVKLMNKKAELLGMKGTYYEDCTGISEKTYTCAKDTAILGCKLFELTSLKNYFTCWRDLVRSGKAELVNLNRLVRFYKGICGFKCWGDCGCVGAKRGKMEICAVAFGCKSAENRDEIMKKLLDRAFENFRIYSPEIPKDFYKKISVEGGEERQVAVYSENTPYVIIPAGTVSEIVCDCKREKTLSAPVKKGQKVGELTCKLKGTKILEIDLKTKNEIKKMNFKCGIKKLWLNLLNFSS